MSTLLKLPLPADQLPEKIRRFGDPAAPKPAKMMAARGLVPVQGGDLLTLLVQLSASDDSEVKAGAIASLDKMPDAVLLPACEAALHPVVLDEVARTFRTREDVIERVVLNAHTVDETIETIAGFASEMMGELIATNQQRLLGAPAIVEALYKNKNVRMSTADRLVELCARHGVHLDGIPAFAEHAKSIEGQLIPEPTEEPLPTDRVFQEVATEEHDEEAIDVDKVEKTEEVKEKFKPLSFRIREMTTGEKLRLTIVGDAAARSLLVRDPNKKISKAAIDSPSMTEAEAISIAYSREVGVDILRTIGNKREWLKGYEIKKALAFNPKTPVGISLRFLGHLRANDLKMLARSRGVPNPVKTAARQRLAKKSNS